MRFTLSKRTIYYIGSLNETKPQMSVYTELGSTSIFSQLTIVCTSPS